MKQVKFILLCLPLLWAACSSRGVEVVKPAFAFSHFVVNPAAGTGLDTIHFIFDATDNVYVLDSVNELDTLSFFVALLGYSDVLTHFSLTRDAAAFPVALADTVTIKPYLIMPKSNVRQADLYFITGFTALTLSFSGVAQTAGHSDFSFSLESESPLSPGSITLRLPVR